MAMRYESETALWSESFAKADPLSKELADPVEADDDEAETYYEAVADPQFGAIEAERRRFSGQLRRRLRRHR